jgi:anti-sigma regulatory factor (Ser/Thr protein kinase)
MQRLAIFLFFMWATAACAQSHHYRQYTVNEGLPSATIYEVIQDREGYIWAGTENGVTRFDGKAFQNFTREDGLTDNVILKIFQDTTGRIWFMPLNGRLCYFLRGKIHNRDNDSLLRVLPDCVPVVSMTQNKEGCLSYRGVAGMVFLDNRNTIRKYPLLQAPPPDSFVVRFHGQGIEAVFSTGNRYEKLFSDHQTEYYYQNWKYYLVRAGIFKRVPGPTISYPITGYPSIQVFQRNTLWLCFPGQGAVGIKGLHEGKPSYVHFLKGKNVGGVCEDNEGNLWFGTLGQGLWVLPGQDKQAIHLVKEDGLPEEAITVLHRDNNNTIWMGSLNNYLYRRDKGRLSVLKVSDMRMSSPGAFYDLSSSRDNTLYYVTSYDFGKLNKGNKPLAFNGKEGYYKGTSYKALSIGPQGRTIAVAPNGLTFYDPEDRNKRNILLYGQKPFRIFTTHWARNGTIWIADIRGLHEWKKDTLIPRYSADPVLREPISRIAELPDGNLIIATRTAGIVVFDGTRVLQILDKKQGLPSNICNRLRADGNVVLVATAAGVAKFIYRNHRLVWERNFTSEDGLLSNEVNDALIYNDSLYVASFSGLSILRLTGEKSTNLPPVYIVKVVYGNKEISETPDTTLAMLESSGNMQFSFIGITFQHPAKVEYLYRLSGSGDDHWYKNSTGQVDYTSLGPGNYVFEVQARKINGAWSEPVRFAFHIRTPIWMQGWFQLLLYGAMLTGVAVGGSAVARQKRKQKMRKLELRDKMIQLEQQALSALMSPHFIFNALNSIQQYLHNNDALSANKYLSFFAKLTRRNMEAVMASEVRLDDELERLELYLQFEKLRFGDKLTYKIIIPEDFDAEEIVVPPMILQPFVENSIWHGLMPLPHGGEVIVRIFTNDPDYFTVEIADNGLGIEVSRGIKHSQGLQHKSKGMRITMERLELWCRKAGKKYSVNIAQRESGSGQSAGTLVKLELPFIA